MPEVHDYRLIWNAQQNNGIIQIRFAENGPAIPLPINSAAEFILVAHMLALSNVALDPDTMRLVVPPRSAGS